MTLEMKPIEERMEGREEGRVEVLSALGITQEEYERIVAEKSDKSDKQ